MELFKLLGTIAIDSSEAEKSIDNITSKSESSESRISGAFKKIGTAVVTYFAVDKIKDFGQAVMETGMAFDAQMSTVASISGATNEELDALREKAKEMGAATSFSATESAQALEYMAMAGWKTDDMLNGLEGVMNLAAASGEDLATTSDIVTDAMTAFGMTADQSTYFADVLAQTASNANTNVSLMGETFKYVAPLAGAMGYTIEDMSAAIGLMANSGIKGSQAGTALRGTITNLASPTDTVAAAMDALGISLVDSDGKTKSFGETLNDLRNGFADLSETEKTQYASAIAGKEGMSGLLAIVNSSESDFNKLTESIKSCAGASQEMADTRLDNLQGDVTLLKSAWEGVQIAISDKLTPVFRDMVEKVTEWLSKIQEKISPVMDKIIDIGKYIAENLSPILMDIGKSLLPVIKDAAKSIKPVLETIIPVIKNVWKYVEPIFKIAVEGIDLIVSYLPDLVNDVLDLVDPLNLIHDEQSIISEECLQMADDVRKLGDDLDDIKQKNADIGQSATEESDHYKDLADRLSTVVDQNGQIKEHCEYTVQQIIDELNPALDTSMEIVDGQLQGYKDISAEIDTIIEKNKAKNILEQGQDSYNQAISDRATEIQKRVEAEGKITECEKELAEIAENQAFFDENGYWKDGFDAAGAAGRVSELEANINSYSQTIDEAKQDIMEFNNVIETYESLGNAYLEGNLGEMQRYNIEFTESIQTAGNATTEALQLQYDNYAEIYDNLVAAQKSGDTSVTDEMINSYAQRRNIAKDELDKSLVMAKEQGKGMPQKYGEGITENEQSATDAASKVGDNAADTLSSKNDKFAAAGSSNANAWSNNFMNGLNSNFGQIINTVESYISYLNGLGGSSSVYVNSASDAALVEARIRSERETATGGIVTHAQTRIVGEDGAEAIVPLERNTEWIDKVAAKVVNSMGSTVSDNRLLNKIDELITTIKSNKIYLDSGTLVGELAPAMDSTLGNISRLKRRGVK
jgi:TP901 family phage tail tape measure protein